MILVSACVIEWSKDPQFWLVSLNTPIPTVWGEGLLWTNSNPKSSIWPSFHFPGGYSGPAQIQSPSIWPSFLCSSFSDNFQWEDGGSTLDATFLKYLSGALREFWAQNSYSLACSCICVWRLMSKRIAADNQDEPMEVESDNTQLILHYICEVYVSPDKKKTDTSNNQL